MTRYAFYPGCSMSSSSIAYDLSLQEVGRQLDLQFREIDDWNCCGATEFHTLNGLAAHALIARNLARACSDCTEVVASCSACFLNLKKTNNLMAEDPTFAGKVNRALDAGGLRYEGGSLSVRHILDVLYEDVGEAAIRARVGQPLAGLRVAPYYGCQIVRPYDDIDNAEYPTRLDELLTWLGAEVVSYPVKTHCCGGHMTQISEPQAFELLRRLLKCADDYHADLIVTLCPMCQLNLDGYQGRVNHHFDTQYQLPVLFFTQLVGLAMGADFETLGIGKEIVAAGPVIEAKLSSAGGR